MPDSTSAGRSRAFAQRSAWSCARSATWSTNSSDQTKNREFPLLDGESGGLELRAISGGNIDAVHLARDGRRDKPLRDIGQDLRPRPVRRLAEAPAARVAHGEELSRGHRHAAVKPRQGRRSLKSERLPRKGYRFLGDIASMSMSAARAVCVWPARRCRTPLGTECSMTIPEPERIVNTQPTDDHGGVRAQHRGASHIMCWCRIGWRALHRLDQQPGNRSCSPIRWRNEPPASRVSRQ